MKQGAQTGNCLQMVLDGIGFTEPVDTRSVPMPNADLHPSEQQKESFRRIRNYLAGRLVGATRDKALMHEVVKCLFCRAKLNGDSDRILGGVTDSIEIANAYRQTFGRLRRELPNIFDAAEEILMDPVSIAFVDSELKSLDLYEPTRDPLGDLYESFVGTAMQQEQGQFFTPQNAVAWLVEALNPQQGERVIDPACGAGGFLSYTARRLKQGGVSAKTIAATLFGIEKDSYLAKLSEAHISLNTLSRSNVLCGDSLAWVAAEGKALPLELGSFDVVLTNPPFGTRIVSASDQVRRLFQLAYRWQKSRDDTTWVKTDNIQNSSPPQVLFIERCISLLRPGGRVGIVVPESLISSATYGYVVQFLREKMEIQAVVGMPESLFKTSGKGGTHTKTCLVVASKRRAKSRPSASAPTFMAEAKWCGHDSRGRQIPKDDLPEILRSFRQRARREKSHLGYLVKSNGSTHSTLAPRYHDPELNSDVQALSRTHELVKIRDLVDTGVLSFGSGDEVGKLAYGTGDIPFIRTSDISNWEIKVDPKHGLSSEVYEKYRSRQDVRAGDILMVRDGTYLIGNCAHVSKYDEQIVFQSHLYKIRTNKPLELSPYLLLALLTSEPVQKQIKAKRVTQDIIDSLGDRVYELILPIPKNRVLKAKIEHMVRSSIHERIEARELAREAVRAVVGPDGRAPKRQDRAQGKGIAVSDQSRRSGARPAAG